MPVVFWNQWIALAILFLVSSLWSEDNVRFGYILVPFMGGYFYWIGWLPFSYLSTIIPLIAFIGVISYLRSHLKYKYGVFGSAGGIIFKIIAYLILLQMAIGFINGLGLFNAEISATPNNAYTVYNLSNAQAAFGASSSGINIVDAVSNGLTIAWMMFKIIWSMFAAIFYIYGPLTTTFGLPLGLSLLIQCGVYMIYGIEVFNIINSKTRTIEV